MRPEPTNFDEGGASLTAGRPTFDTGAQIFDGRAPAFDAESASLTGEVAAFDRGVAVFDRWPGIFDGKDRKLPQQPAVPSDPGSVEDDNNLITIRRDIRQVSACAQRGKFPQAN